ncbi:MAG: hypothetical protein WA876_08075 [Candidatus Acidiferrales bacterium]
MDDESNEGKKQEQMDQDAGDVKQHKGADPHNDQDQGNSEKWAESHVQEPPRV